MKLGVALALLALMGPTDVGTTDAVLELPRGLVLPVVLLTEQRYL
jgi:hypothetical protein